jgi:hypothetical protein
LRQNAKARGVFFGITQPEFIAWYEATPKLCHYCGATPEYLAGNERLYERHRGLTTDRKDNSKGYANGNLALACYTCNRTKCDIFTEQEMLEIGAKYLRPKVERGQHI